MRLLAMMVAIMLGLPAAAGPLVSPGDVLAVVTHDWNDDGGQDRAVLVAGEETADLYIYLSTDTTDERRLALHSRAIVWRGLAWGTQPGLSVNERGSLLVHAMNEAIGRNRWHQTLTIALRGRSFLVAGFTHQGYDTLDPDNQFICDINLFSGKGLLNGKPFQSTVRAMPADQWGAERGPELSTLCPET